MEKTKKAIQEVYEMLKARQVNPSGSFDNVGRFWGREEEFLKNIRTPSRAFPYSHMAALRTKKYVNFIAKKFKCSNKEMLLKHL
jgi:RPA family protein